MKTNHAKKRRALLEKIEQFGDDPYLKESYEAKLTILTKQIEINEDQTQLHDIITATKDIMVKLNKQLIEGPASDGTSFLCSKEYSIADMQWGLTLVRLKLRNYDDLFWGEYPAIEAYCKRLASRPAFQKAVIPYQSKNKVFKLVIRRKLERHGKTIIAGVTLVALGYLGYALYGRGGGNMIEL